MQSQENKNSGFSKKILIISIIVIFFITLFNNSGDLVVLKEPMGSKLIINNINGQSEEYSESSPIFIHNDSELAIFAMSGDGLSWETAFRFENIRFNLNVSNYACIISNTTKFTIFENCEFKIPIEYYQSQTTGFLINNSKNIQVIDSNFISNTLVSIGTSKGLNIVNSSDLIIQRCYFSNWKLAVFISNSSLINLKQNLFQWSSVGIYIENCSNIEIFRNQMHIDESKSYQYFFEIYIMENLNVIENEIFSNGGSMLNYNFEAKYHLNIYQSINLNFSNNDFAQIPTSISFSKCKQILFSNNTLSAYLNFYFAYDIEILDNKFEYSEWGISGTNIFDVEIRGNEFKNIAKNIFLFSYQTESSDSYLEMFPEWYEIPNQSQEEILENKIYLKYGTLYDDLPDNFYFHNNFVRLQFSMYLFICFITCFLVILIGQFIRNNLTLHSIRNTDAIDCPNPKKSLRKSSNFNYKEQILLMHKYKFQKRVLSSLFLFFVYIAYGISEIFDQGGLANYIIQNYTGDFIHSYYSIIGLAVNVELIVFGALLCLFCYSQLNKANKIPIMFENYQDKLDKRSKKILFLFSVLLFILTHLIIFLMVFKNVYYLSLLLSIIGFITFIYSLILSKRRNYDDISWESFIFGIMSLFGFILLNVKLISISGNSFFYSDVIVINTQRLVLISSIVSLFIGWFRNIDKLESPQSIDKNRSD